MDTGWGGGELRVDTGRGGVVAVGGCVYTGGVGSMCVHRWVMGMWQASLGVKGEDSSVRRYKWAGPVR